MVTAVIRKIKQCRQIKWTVLFLVLLLAGCAAGSVRAKAGEKVSTQLFDFTVSDPRTLTEYPGVSIPEGQRLVSMMITVTNTCQETLPLFAQDFQFQWGEDSFGSCLDAVDGGMLPYTWDLEPGDTREGTVLVLLPEKYDRLTVAYQELRADGSQAGTYFVEVPL